MAKKYINWKTKGMNRDMSVSAFNPEFAFENRNLRLATNEGNTMMSWVNERGTKKMTLNIATGLWEENFNKKYLDSITGIPVGTAVLNHKLIIFTCSDLIYVFEKSTKDENTLEGKILYFGTLGFSPEYPIETLVSYESENIQKVYWTDNKNQPRVINIVGSIEKGNDNQFDFVPKLQLNEEIKVTKLLGSGEFSPGVIQYAFTYYNKYGQESNIFYTTPLYYISYNDRGASPEGKVGNSFTINITNADSRFDFIRVYSIHRTSINAVPETRRVTDLVVSGTTLSYTDNGLAGDTIDPTELLYIGGEEVIFGTMAQKDNTLFLGNIKLQRRAIDSSVKNYFKNKRIDFKISTKTEKIKKISSPEIKGYYPYVNQLSMNAYQFKTFKYLEYYRFGIQAQHYTGKWSEPIWINDVRNTKHIDTKFYNSEDIGLPIAEYSLDDKDIINTLVSEGYVKIRPLVVYPTVNDREVVCQGVLCPTVYNVSDRYGNSPFAQSSWFVRPNAPFDEYKASHYNQNASGEWGGDWMELGQYLGNPSLYSRAGIMSNSRNVVKDSTTNFDINGINKGAWAEFRNNRPIPGNNERNAEIQCIWNPPTPYVSDTATDSEIASWVSNNSENYYIDQSILTLHSPDIEFNDEIRAMDTSGMKLRIVGMVPVTAFASDIDIQTSTPVNNFYDSSDLPIGFYKEHIGVENAFVSNSGYPAFIQKTGDSHFGWKGMLSGAFWFDELTAYKKDTGNTGHLTTGFVVYPWHRNGSLNNTKFATDGYKSAMLDKKKLSNMRYSYKSVYFDYENIWNAYKENDNDKTGISGVAVFDSNEVSMVRIPAQHNSGLTDINYYGNVDKLLSISRIGDKKEGYPIMTTGTQNADSNAHLLFSGNYMQIDSRFTDQITGIDPVRIKYKSTPHAVLALNYSKSGAQRILPTIQDRDNLGSPWNVNYVGGNITSGQHPFWDKNKSIKSISQDVITTGIVGDASGIGGIQYGWLWLGELYNDNVVNRFGGQTQEAFQSNQWLPCGEPIALLDEEQNVKESITLKWEGGDTYYQRYDHIKTYPFTLEDQNAVTDIISFMCETRVNIDGRYDRNRGQTSNFAITPTNFNLVNDVYTQQDNFFTYKILDEDTYKSTDFPNNITWTKTKQNGADVDLWTNITLANTLELDGDKGTVNKLIRLNNQLLSFQDKGIAQILYNENTQISTTEGVPIEIANSQKVQGKRYYSDTVGCSNKWSVVQTPAGIYFMDSNEKSIYLFNGQLNNISTTGGFNSWAKQNIPSSNVDWTPNAFDSFATYYDKLNQDVLFINKETALAYSEKFNCFTSFYDYEGVSYFNSLDDIGIWIKGSDLYQHQAGEYCNFFDENKPFSMTLIANQEPHMDKIFTNLEFRACVEGEGSYDETKNKFVPSLPFDSLEAWNEYQHGISTLNNRSANDRFTHGKENEILARKFRMWACDIPRDNAKVDTTTESLMGIKRFKARPLDRIRNPWAYIKLTKNAAAEKSFLNKTEIHDIMATYFG